MLKVRYEIQMTDRNPNMTDMPPGSHHYRVRFRRGNRQLTTFFSCGPALGWPKPGEVLECLVSDMHTANSCRDFEDFCMEFGYDPDSRKAEATWKAIQAQGPKVEALLGPKLLVRLQNADRPDLFLQNQCMEDESNLGL